jgi:hypothetical protein
VEARAGSDRYRDALREVVRIRTSTDSFRKAVRQLRGPAIEEAVEAIMWAIGSGASSARAASRIQDAGDLHTLEILLRTEINAAYGVANMQSMVATPGFAGFRFLLSPLHVPADVCDLLSTQNLYGLGPGVYPDAARLPWPAHPGTISHFVMVFQNEITDADREGRETQLAAIQRIAPLLRRMRRQRQLPSYFDAALWATSGNRERT